MAPGKAVLAAGLVLIAEQMRRRRPLRTPPASDSQVAVFDDFAAEAMAGIALDDRHALMSMAMLPRLPSRRWHEGSRSAWTSACDHAPPIVGFDFKR